MYVSPLKIDKLKSDYGLFRYLISSIRPKTKSVLSINIPRKIFA